MADVSEKVAGHLESMGADEILTRSSQVEKIDTVVRRTFGLDTPVAGTGAVNLHVLTGARAIVQVNQKNELQSFVSARQVGGIKSMPYFSVPGGISEEPILKYRM